ncbi:MAG TPA: diaminopimelate epimerase [Acidobacteriaceae bacterium]|nr:diaminopimelate epimerase [Acidobacteriaceae bacterium]
MIPEGRAFYKMTGSGNDFVFVDARTDPPGHLEDPSVIRAICSRGTGVGADGIVFLVESEAAAVHMRYFNSDGSLAEMCGNAALCTTRLAVELGLASPDGFVIESDSGLLAARYRDDLPEVDLESVRAVQSDFPVDLKSGEQRAGYAVAGVPHLVVRCEDVGAIDVVGRGRPLRHHRDLPKGANVNFVSRGAPEDSWRIRTYERGVEGETLACGTGAVAAAILLTAWRDATGDVPLVTKSGRTLRVRIAGQEQGLRPSLSGEGRIVFVGRFGEITTRA